MQVAAERGGQEAFSDRAAYPGVCLVAGAPGVHVFTGAVGELAHRGLDLPNRGLPDLVRASVHYYNTDDELDQLITALPSPTSHA